MTIRDELADINAAFSRALADQDADQVAQFYTEDARYLAPGSPIVKGRTEIAELFREHLAARPRTTQFVTGDVLESGDLVVDVGRITGAGGHSAKYVVVYERQGDGRLKIAVDAYSSDSLASA